MKKIIQRIFKLLLFGVIAFIILSSLGAGYLVNSFVNSFIHPGRLPSTSTPARFNISMWEDVTLITDDGLSLEGWYIPATPQQDGSAVILIHGLAGNKDHMLSDAEYLSEAGYGVLLFDLRNHGNSDGELTTFGFNEMQDMQTAISFLQAQPEVNHELISLYGYSLGGSVVLEAAANMPEIHSVILLSTFSSLEENAQEIVGGLIDQPNTQTHWIALRLGEWKAGIPITEVNSTENIQSIAPRPVLLMHGEKDRLIPVANSYRLFEAASEPKELLIIPNADHNDVKPIGAEMIETAVLDFLAAHQDQ
ncbi:MAG: alpha/beta fold hydrolase [Chloroflexota bacterium]